MVIEDKLSILRANGRSGRVKVMIIGLGSVGNYLLTYLLSMADEGIDVIVAGRDESKMRSDVNIAVVSALIRRQLRSHVTVAGGVNLEDVDSIASCIAEHDPDIIVNSSRVYAGLKYGSISWQAVRAYGIWTPLSIRYIRNVMEACKRASSHALVINTSYSDATIPWLKSAGVEYPEFGSGNLNHIAPRLKLAASKKADIEPWDVSVDIATAHFHDVVISKEGHDEGVFQLMKISDREGELGLGYEEILSQCAISMPVDQKRNMMNASSNFDIVRCLVSATRDGNRERFLSPGAFGEIGGYPVVVDGTDEVVKAAIDESVFSIGEMRARNRASIALDGVENIEHGCLIYTDELIDKAEHAFGVRLPKQVAFDEIDSTATFIVDEIIRPELERRKQER